MIEFDYWPTPSGQKIAMFLEEPGLEYTIHPIDISAADQFKREFLALSPNNRMPAIIDTAQADGGEPVTVFESGAIGAETGEVMTATQTAMLARQPYQQLRGAVIAHPTMAEGLGPLLANVPPR